MPKEETRTSGKKQQAMPRKLNLNSKVKDSPNKPHKKTKSLKKGLSNE